MLSPVTADMFHHALTASTSCNSQLVTADGNVTQPQQVISETFFTANHLTDSNKTKQRQLGTRAKVIWLFYHTHQMAARVVKLVLVGALPLMNSSQHSQNKNA